MQITPAAQPSAGSSEPETIRPPVDSQQLLGSGKVMHIAHNGTVYVLRATSKGGLILTK